MPSFDPRPAAPSGQWSAAHTEFGYGEESNPPTGVTLPQWIGKRAQRHGDRMAVTFVSDDHGERSWTYQELWDRACRVAARLPNAGLPSPRGLLLFEPGLEFLAGFLGCQIAGWIPVPTCYPKAGRQLPRLDSAATDCQASAIIGDGRTIENINPSNLCSEARSIPRVITDCEPEPTLDASVDHATSSVDPEALALLQYTSGSTNDPKGVMIRHRNLMANLEAIRRGFQIPWQPDDTENPLCGVFWLPFFHDMGLIGGILAPLYVGGRAVLMSPRSFLQRPIRWLQAITDYGAQISGAPNFAYQLCVDRISPDQTDKLDLSRWRTAFCGAEPILQRTLHDFASRFSACRFSSTAFYPCYGLAEATLLAAGGDGPAEPTVVTVQRESLSAGQPIIDPQGRGRGFQKLVSCGRAVDQTELLVVNPTSREVVAECAVGEIWLRGASIGAGYWNRIQENQSQFDASLADGRAGYFRTGDMGFIHDGHLYVTGRIRDVIILRGRNLFPQDIESTVMETLGPQSGQCAALAVQSGRGESLAIVAELPRRTDEFSYPHLVRDVRRAVIEVHEVDPTHLLLVRQATIPLTSSGKVRRSLCREMFDSDQIQAKYRYDRASAGEQTPIPIPNLPADPGENERESMTRAIEAWMTEWLIVRAGVHPSDVDLEKSFAEYGLDSMTAVEMSGEIEDWSGIELTPVVAVTHPNVARIAAFIVNERIEAPERGT